MTKLARLLFGLSLLVSSLYPLVATAQADKPVSIVVFARDPSAPAKGKLLEQVARERGLTLEWVFTDRAQPAELAQKFAGADLIMFDWVMDFLLPQIFAQVQEPMKAYPGKVWGGAMWRRPDISKGLTPEQGQRILDYYANGGTENFRNLMDYIKVAVMGRTRHSTTPMRRAR
jgi:cobaltochelatase CobN